MDVPKGLWYKSPTGKIIDADELERNLFVSQKTVFTLELAVPILKFCLITTSL
jgi:acetyl-CoA carboxylase carboxyl transferase subunit beta